MILAKGERRKKNLGDEKHAELYTNPYKSEHKQGIGLSCLDTGAIIGYC